MELADDGDRYDLKQMLMKSSISRVPEELRKHEAAQQKSERWRPEEDRGQRWVWREGRLAVGLRALIARENCAMI